MNWNANSGFFMTGGWSGYKRRGLGDVIQNEKLF